jgi:lambda family phage portal protein
MAAGKVGRPSRAEVAARTAAQTPGAKAPVVTNKYDAAGTGKRMAGWNPPSSGPNKAVVGIQKIRDRARDVVRNDWTGESITQKWSTNLIGIGIRARLTRIKDKTRKQELTDLWDEFVDAADADGVLNFYGLQTLGVRSWIGSGEVFLRRRPRRIDSGLSVPLQLQLVEAEYVPMLDADSYTGMPRGNTIRSGIERDARGQRVAYWMYREHPGDGYSGSIDRTKLLRIPASDVSHIYMPDRPGALRGVSMLASILPQLRDIGNYRDAVLLRQQLSNLFVAFLTRKLGEGDDETDPLTGKAIEGTFDKPLMGLQPGIVQELEDGQDVKFANPPEAGTTFSDYLRTELMGPAAASGLPYEVFSGDIKEVSDRTLRVIINEFRRLAEQRQWQVVIPMMCQRTRSWWTDAAVLAGKVSLAEMNDVRRVEWSPHGWAYIHPVQDPQGKKMEVEAGFRSRSSVIGERGDDPEAVDQERADDMQREMDLEIYVDPTGKVDAGGNPIVEEQDGIDNDEYTAPPNPTALEQALERRAEAEADALKAKAERLRREPETPQMTLFETEQLALTRRVIDILGPDDEHGE